MSESFKPTKSVEEQGFKESLLLGLAKKGLKEFKTAFEPLDYPDGAVI